MPQSMPQLAQVSPLLQLRSPQKGCAVQKPSEQLPLWHAASFRQRLPFGSRSWQKNRASQKPSQSASPVQP